MKRYFKEAWAALRSQPLVCWVSIAGTALAIFMIMVVVLIEDIEVAPYAPESNRDRWLVQRAASITNDNWEEGMGSNGGMGYKLIKQLFYEMETPEAVTAMDFSPYESLMSVSSGTAFGANRKGVDDGYWKVMDFTFIEGKPFDKGEFEAGIPVAVLSESIARRLFGTTDVVGREFNIDYLPYRVKGVVKDVSTLATGAYSDVWVPFTSTNTVDFFWCEYMGAFSAIILPRSKADIPKVREEYNKLMAKIGEEAKVNGWKFIIRERPYDQETAVNTPWANQEPEMDSVRLRRYFTWAILLLVPAVNLSSMTHSRLSKRREEIGVRRAFGAKKGGILTDLFIENLIITVIAGIIGLILSVVFAMFGAEYIFSAQSMTGTVTNLSPMMLLSWKTFGLAMIFCLILNIISASLPAWQASRTNIVNALNGKKK